MGRHGPKRAPALASVPEERIRELIQEWIDDIPGRELSGLVRWTRDVAGLTQMESGFFGVSFRELIPVLQKLEEEQLNPGEGATGPFDMGEEKDG